MTKSCENVAYMRWRKDIREGELKLKNYLRKERDMKVKEVNKIVSRSRESILATRKGWTLNQVILPIKSVLF